MGRVEQYLLNQIDQNGSIHLTLIDPEKTKPDRAASIAQSLEACGTSAVMVGGSTLVSVSELDRVVQALKKKVSVPVILFPSNITGISKYADAIFFMSLINSNNPLFITGTQALGAPLIKKYNLEPISLGYIIVGEGSTAAYIGQAHPIPHNKPEIATMYALAAQYLGMHFIYLEAGSGSNQPIPPKMVAIVKGNLNIPLIVGGGIRARADAKAAVKAGADIIVTGTIIEEDLTGSAVRHLITDIKKYYKK